MPDASTTDAPVLAKTLIPQDLHDRGYVKPWLDKPWTPELAAEVFKKLDGAESLIGKKTLIPGADAKPEELDAFYSKLRPEKDTDYEFKMGEKPDENFVKELRAAAHGAGLDKRQLAKFVDGLAPGMAARQKAVADAQEKQDKDFDEIVKTTFGKDNEKILARVRESIREHTPEPLKPFIDKLDNNSLAILTGVINGVLVKYASEDDLKRGDKGGAGAGGDKAVLQEEARTLQASKAWGDFQHPDHEKTVKRVTEIYASPVFKV